MLHRPRFRNVVGCSAIALSAGLALPAQAQTAPSTGSGQLEEITVTAQRTETRLEHTPISVSVYSAASLDKADIRSIVDLDKRIPGVTITQSGAWPVNITIRGVGYGGLQDNSAIPGVAFMQNGVYIASPVSLSGAFLDVDQVEVLRGPQGTVAGQNADGGAVNLTNRQPVLDVFHADAEASYGSYDYNRMRVATNVPIGDTLAVRAAFQHEGHDGWFYAPNQPTTHHVGNEDNWTACLTALWKPTDRLSVTLWGEFADSDSNGFAAKNIFDPLPGTYTTSNDTASPQKTRTRTVAGTLAYDLGFGTFKSTTSYQYAFSGGKTSADMLDRADALQIYGVKDELAVYDRVNKTITEEANLSHSGGKLDWIVGAFYLHSKGRQLAFETQQSSATRLPYTPTFDPTSDEAAALYAAGLSFVSRDNSNRTSAAVYGQATYHFTDRLRLTGGARYSYDKYTDDAELFFGAPETNVSKFTKVTGKAAVEFDPWQGSTLYASFSTGVKPGGTNLVSTPTMIPKSFEHEFVRSYEIGSKNEFFDHKLRLNLSGFYSDYRNQQESSEDPLPFEGGNINIPKSHIYGLEGEMSWILPAGFRFDGNMAVMRSKIDSHVLALEPYQAQLINRLNGGPFVGNDLADRANALTDVYGNQLGRVPHFSAAAGINKTFDVAEAGTLDAFVQVNYRSAYWFRYFNDPAVDRVGKQFFMNLNLRFQPESKPYYVSFEVTNLTASHDIAARYAEDFGVGGVFDSPVPPRQFIGRIGFNF